MYKIYFFINSSTFFNSIKTLFSLVDKTAALFCYEIKTCQWFQREGYNTPIIYFFKFQRKLAPSLFSLQLLPTPSHFWSLFANKLDRQFFVFTQPRRARFFFSKSALAVTPSFNPPSLKIESAILCMPFAQKNLLLLLLLSQQQQPSRANNVSSN